MLTHAAHRVINALRKAIEAVDSSSDVELGRSHGNRLVEARRLLAGVRSDLTLAYGSPNHKEEK